MNVSQYQASNFDTTSIYEYLFDIFDSEWPNINEFFQNNSNMYVCDKIVNSACGQTSYCNNILFTFVICKSNKVKYANALTLINMFYNIGFDMINDDDINFTTNIAHSHLVLNKPLIFQKIIDNKSIIFTLECSSHNILKFMNRVSVDNLCNYMSNQGIIYCKSIYDIVNNIERLTLPRFSLLLKMPNILINLINSKNINKLYICKYKLSYGVIKYLLNSNYIKQFVNCNLKTFNLTTIDKHANVSHIDCNLTRHILIALIVDKFINKN